VWLNDGSGRFKRGQGLRFGRYESIALGEVTGDGWVDLLAAGVDGYQVWRGQGNGHFVADDRASY
jgi:hypothetical protein